MCICVWLRSPGDNWHVQSYKLHILLVVATKKSASFTSADMAEEVIFDLYLIGNICMTCSLEHVDFEQISWWLKPVI